MAAEDFRRPARKHTTQIYNNLIIREKSSYIEHKIWF